MLKEEVFEFLYSMPLSDFLDYIEKEPSMSISEDRSTIQISVEVTSHPEVKVEYRFEPGSRPSDFYAWTFRLFLGVLNRKLLSQMDVSRRYIPYSDMEGKKEELIYYIERATVDAGRPSERDDFITNEDVLSEEHKEILCSLTNIKFAEEIGLHLATETNVDSFTFVTHSGVDGISMDNEYSLSSESNVAKDFIGYLEGEEVQDYYDDMSEVFLDLEQRVPTNAELVIGYNIVINILRHIAEKEIMLREVIGLSDGSTSSNWTSSSTDTDSERVDLTDEERSYLGSLISNSESPPFQLEGIQNLLERGYTDSREVNFFPQTDAGHPDGGRLFPLSSSKSLRSIRTRHVSVMQSKLSAMGGHRFYENMSQYVELINLDVEESAEDWLFTFLLSEPSSTESFNLYYEYTDEDFVSNFLNFLHTNMEEVLWDNLSTRFSHQVAKEIHGASFNSIVDSVVLAMVNSTNEISVYDYLKTKEDFPKYTAEDIASTLEGIESIATYSHNRAYENILKEDLYPLIYKYFPRMGLEVKKESVRVCSGLLRIELFHQLSSDIEAWTEMLNRFLSYIR